MSGIDVLRALREPDAPPVDVMAITSAKNVDTLRRALQGGVIHYPREAFLLRHLPRAAREGRRSAREHESRAGGRSGRDRPALLAAPRAGWARAPERHLGTDDRARLGGRRRREG